MNKELSLTQMNTDKGGLTQMKMLVDTIVIETAMVSTPIPLRGRVAGLSHAEGVEGCTDVSMYPTSVPGRKFIRLILPSIRVHPC